MGLAVGLASAKWEDAAKAGFQILPDVLFKHQHALGLSAVDLVVLANLTLHWWYPDQKPFPRGSTVARRMGVDVRTVQRSLARLIELGLVRREKVAGTGPEKFDLSGLVERLNTLARSDASYQHRMNEAVFATSTSLEDIF